MKKKFTIRLIKKIIEFIITIIILLIISFFVMEFLDFKIKMPFNYEL